MKSFIFVVDTSGDINIFKNIDAAEQYLEPPDVYSNEYEIFDGDGVRLQAIVETKEKKFFLKKITIHKIKLQFTNANEKEILRHHLENFINNIKKRKMIEVSKEENTLENLIEKVIPYALIE